MRTRRLLSFGASKIATDHAQRANVAAKQEAKRKAIEQRINDDLSSCGKSTFTYPTWVDIR